MVAVEKMVVRGKQVSLDDIYKFFIENEDEVFGEFAGDLKGGIITNEDDLDEWISNWFIAGFGETSFTFHNIMFFILQMTS